MWKLNKNKIETRNQTKVNLTETEQRIGGQAMGDWGRGGEIPGELGASRCEVGET